MMTAAIDLVSSQNNENIWGNAINIVELPLKAQLSSDVVIITLATFNLWLFISWGVIYSRMVSQESI
jgi:hypothetical protein